MDAARILKAVTALVFPPRCQLCERFCPSPLCERCADSFERIRPPFCERCGYPFDPNARARPLCSACSQNGRELEAARSFGLHCGALRDAVNTLKFRGKVRLAGPLGRLMADLFGAEGDRPHQLSVDEITHIIPVPLHERRKTQRGFDQAELLAGALGEAISRPVRTGLLVRVRNTRPQVGLGPTERDANVRGAFEVRYRLPTPGVRALLVDDVYTTGATLRACARALRSGGAEAVHAATVSRAAPEWHPASDLVPAL